MFQDVNVAKSAPFALLTKYQKSLYPPPKFSKLFPFWQITRNSPTISHLNNEKWNPQISQQIARKSLNSPPPPMNHAKSTRFPLNPTNPCSLTVPQPFLQQISRNSLNSQILRVVDVKLTNFALIPTNLLFYFLDSRKTGSSTLLARFTRISQP